MRRWAPADMTAVLRSTGLDYDGGYPAKQAHADQPQAEESHVGSHCEPETKDGKDATDNEQSGHDARL